MNAMAAMEVMPETRARERLRQILSGGTIRVPGCIPSERAAYEFATNRPVHPSRHGR